MGVDEGGGGVGVGGLGHTISALPWGGGGGAEDFLLIFRGGYMILFKII